MQVNLSPSSAWLDRFIAVTADEVRNSSGCHPDEVQALSDYLNGIISAEEAAQEITVLIPDEPNPEEAISRLWNLICCNLARLNADDRNKTLDLLAQIQALDERASIIEWDQLPGLGHYWYAAYGEGGYGCPPGAKSYGGKDMNYEHRPLCEAIGRTGAEMLLRGFDMVIEEHCCYNLLNELCSNWIFLDGLISEIFGWLDAAGWTLKEKAESEQWVTWKEAMARMSQDETDQSQLSQAGRRLAAQCPELM